MNKKDDIDILFENIEGTLDIMEPSADHEMRFLEKLKEQHKIVPLHTKKQNWRKPLAIAATVAIIFGMLSISLVLNQKEETDLASVSSKMEETQNFFTVAIQVQLEEIHKNPSPETEKLVKDAMVQLEKLENNYLQLQKDLLQSNHDKRVISAMITNFQKRATLLEGVLEKMNTVKTLNLLEDENNIL
ncbi:hypothetical protein GCM10022393_13500 [Aquimarina addita]|uniref:Anti-sigma factor n=1 Tax=Aquimarina addita TaxID=870485 RepID=A0ABP7XF71_9FLAO